MNKKEFEDVLRENNYVKHISLIDLYINKQSISHGFILKDKSVFVVKISFSQINLKEQFKEVLYSSIDFNRYGLKRIDLIRKKQSIKKKMGKAPEKINASEYEEDFNQFVVEA